ncbi:MAG: oligosaccharide flippase family protein [Bacteroidales bacterium]
MDLDFIKKATQGVANRSLNLIYGFGYLILVVRGLPQEEYGSLALCMSLVAIIDVLRLNWITTTSLKFLAAAKDKNEYATTFTAIVCLFSIITGIVSILFFTLSDHMAVFFKIKGLSILFKLIPLYYISNFLKSLTEWILISRQQLRNLVILNLFSTGLNLVLLLMLTIMGKLNCARDVLLILSLGGFCASVVALFFSLGQLLTLKKVNWDIIKNIVQFGGPALGDNICGMVLERLDVILLGIYTSPISVAVYNAGKRLADAYETLLQGAWLVVYPSASNQAGNIAMLRNIYRTAITHLFLVLIPLIMIATIFAYPIIVSIFGGNYVKASVIFQLASINVLFRVFLVFGGSILIGGLDKINLDLYTMFFLVIINACLNLLLIPKLNIIGAAIAMLTTTALGAFIKNHLVCVTLKVNIRDFIFNKGTRSCF